MEPSLEAEVFHIEQTGCSDRILDTHFYVFLRNCDDLPRGRVIHRRKVEVTSVSSQSFHVKIVIVEDHLMMRDVIKKVCSTEFGYSVVGETDSGVQAVELILKHRPDAVILDLSLPDMDGFNVADRVLKVIPSLRILMLSSHCDDYTLFRVEKSGVHGFIDKNSNTLDILRDALKAIAEGRIYFSQAFQAARMARRSDPRSFVKVLSDWERAILSLIGQGLSDEEIGERLNLSPRTVQTHRSNILRKLDLKGTPKLIAFAVEHGFTQVQSKHGSIPVYT